MRVIINLVKLFIVLIFLFFVFKEAGIVTAIFCGYLFSRSIANQGQLMEMAELLDKKFEYLNSQIDQLNDQLKDRDNCRV